MKTHLNPNGILCPIKAFKIKNIVLGTAEATDKSDVKPACIGVKTSVSLDVTFRNLYIQY